MADRLRPLWDFEDLDGSERRLRAQLEQEDSDAGRAEVLTQLARVETLRGDFEASARLLDEARTLAGTSPVATVRIELEHGRMLRSSGDPEAAFPFFRSAFEHALAAGDHFLAGDAAHMCAIAGSARGRMEEWTRRGLELTEREQEAAYWAGPLLNNLGWAYFETGEYERALETFERALEARKRDPDNQIAIVWAQEAIDETLKALGRWR
jgi:tetratricopeptide (TPR) repeat protein